jgi:hypothetical protein
MEVMQSHECALFSDRVLQAECDSVEKLQMMQDLPYLLYGSKPTVQEQSLN